MRVVRIVSVLAQPKLPRAAGIGCYDCPHPPTVGTVTPQPYGDDVLVSSWRSDHGWQEDGSGKALQAVDA